MSAGQAPVDAAGASLHAENLRLRKAIRDVVAMATLPAVWIGQGADGIARSLASALMTTLAVDLVYVRIGEPAGGRGGRCLNSRRVLSESQADAATSAVEALLTGGGGVEPVIHDPLDGGTLRAAITRFGVQDRSGVLLAASRDESFPTEIERAILGVSANQTAIVLQRLRAEQVSEESRANLDSALQAADLGHWRLSLVDGRIEGNTRFDQIFGYEGVAPRWNYPILLDHIAPEDRERVDGARRYAVATRAPWEVECRIGARNEAARWVWIKGKLLGYHEGEPDVLTGVIADISGRKQIERELRDARGRLQAALTAGAIVTWTWDIATNRMWADEALALLFGLDASAASGGILDPYLEAIHPADRARVVETLSRAVESDGDYSADYRVTQHDGSVRWVAARGRVERDPEGRPLRMPGVLVDITERKALEHELGMRIAELAAMDQRKDEFLATLAHELRNPLAPIRNSLQILKMPRVDADMAARVREVMERQVNQLVRLVDDLLDVSRVMRGKIDLRREPTELSNVIARAVETVQPLIEAHGHSLQIDLPSDSLLLDVDPVRLSQVVGNLVGNAAKYTDNGGQIRIKAVRDGDDVILSVVDNGIGIPSHMLGDVFDLFVQVDEASSRSHGGLGIGLTLVKNLVEMHGGHVEVRSDGVGRGSEFRVRLPILDSLVAQSALPAGIKHGRADPRRVLVVDDNHDAAESLSVLLKLKGHDVRTAHDGEAALSAARDFRPQLILLDLGMPGMDGHEVARRLRGDPVIQGCVVAALTGWGQLKDRERTSASGFDAHLVKPVDLSELDALLASAATAGSAPANPANRSPAIFPGAAAARQPRK